MRVEQKGTKVYCVQTMTCFNGRKKQPLEWLLAGDFLIPAEDQIDEGRRSLGVVKIKIGVMNIVQHIWLFGKLRNREPKITVIKTDLLVVFLFLKHSLVPLGSNCALF